MTSFERGDVVLVDLGMVGKTRPCVVISRRQPDRQRAMCVVAPLTTESRGGECEVTFPKPPWLRETSVVNLVGIAGVDHAKIIRRLAVFPPDAFERVLDTAAVMLEL